MLVEAISDTSKQTNIVGIGEAFITSFMFTWTDEAPPWSSSSVLDHGSLSPVFESRLGISEVALSDILEAFRLPENIKRIREAQDNSGNDMLKTMQIVFPLATVIQMEIMPKYGFTGDGDG
ncbi:hypothetical protein LSH36_247g02036 [Paralvinella palmiformis]|uniref:Protein C10 n=1 Tax=Paralvinella palmiformis TaxID=53620 RepID=A0AAD9N3A7_9ANNE|nr:hypothetical protein LSH36_247g02036 [Paralvinella palmiformis]